MGTPNEEIIKQGVCNNGIEAGYMMTTEMDQISLPYGGGSQKRRWRETERRLTKTYWSNY